MKNNFIYNSGVLSNGELQSRATFISQSKIILNNVDSLSSQLVDSNCEYIILHDFDLDNGSITIPQNCTLNFQRGSIMGGTITLQNTKLEGDVKWTGTTISGSCANDILTPQMFGAYPTLNETESNKTQHTLAFQNLTRIVENQNTISKIVYIPAGHYSINEKLSFKYINKLYGEGESTVLDFYDGLGGLYVGRYSSENQYNRCTILDNVTITADVPNQQTYIVVNNVSGINVDDWLIITDSADYSFCGDRASYRTSELVQVREIDSENNTIYFKTSLYGKYFVSYTENNEHTLSNVPNYRTIISKIELLNYDISNIKIVSHTSNNNNRTYYTFHVCGFINSRLDGIDIYNYGNDVAANITLGNNFVIENCIIKSYTEYQTDAYGLSLSHVQNFKIANCTFKAKSHALSHGGGNSVFGINNRNFVIEQIYIDKHQENRKIDIDVHANAEYYLYKNIICPHAICDTGGYNVTVEDCILYDISTGFQQAGLTIRGCELMNCSENHLLSAVYPEAGHPEANPLVDYDKYSFIFENNKFHGNFMFDLQYEPYYFRNMIFRNNICEGNIGLVDGCMYNVFIDNNISSKGGIRCRLSSDMTEINNNILSDGWINIEPNTATKGSINNNIIKNSYPQDTHDIAKSDYLLILKRFTGFVINNNVSCLNENQQLFLINNNCDIQFNNNYFQRGIGYYSGAVGDALNSDITFNNNVYNSLRSIPIYNGGNANIKCDKETYYNANINRDTVLSAVGETLYIKNTNKLGYISNAPYGNLILTLTTPEKNTGVELEAITENILVKDKVYHVRMRVNDLNEIYFSKTINHATEDLYRVWYENAGTTGIIKAPDPTVYPYIYVKSYNGLVWFKFYENRGVSEYDGAIMGVKRSGRTSDRPVGQNIYEGFKYYDTTLSKFIYVKSIDNNFNVTWIEYDGAVAGVNRIGTTAQRPTGNNIYVGFKYIDTDINKEIYASAISGNTVTWTELTNLSVNYAYD